MSLDLSDGNTDPLMEEAEAEASDIVKAINNMTMEEYIQYREELLKSASNFRKLIGGEIH